MLRKKRSVPHLDSEKLVNRVSQIWGIPVKKIKPVVVEDPRLGGNALHHMHLNLVEVGSKDHRQAIDHENVHVIHNLLLPEKIFKKVVLNPKNPMDVVRVGLNTLATSFGAYPVRDQHKYAGELIADLNSGNASVSAAYLRNSATKISIPASIALPPLSGIKTAGRYIDMSLQKRPIKKIFSRHGEDGIIMLAAQPPKVIGALELHLWEKKMREKGLLKESGGLSDKGIVLLQKELPTKKILERLDNMKKQREIQQTK